MLYKEERVKVYTKTKNEEAILLCIDSFLLIKKSSDTWKKFVSLFFRRFEFPGGEFPRKFNRKIIIIIIIIGIEN